MPIILSALLIWVLLINTSHANTYLQNQYQNDVYALIKARNGLNNTLNFMQSREDLFPSSPLKQARKLTRQQREIIWQTWESFLDYVLAIDSIGRYYSDLDEHYQQAQAKYFKIAFAAFLANYRYAMAFITLCNNDANFDIVLNEAVPELGMPSGSYRQLKFRYLNLIHGAKFAVMSAREIASNDAKNKQLQQFIDADKKVVWRAGLIGEGPINTLKNSTQIIRDGLFAAWFPVQKGVSEWMGDIKVKRKNRSLISQQQITSMIPQLQPGDILLERREWYLSNIGLPGFWPHAALYIGSEQEREEYFDTEAIRAWLTEQHSDFTNFNQWLSEIYPGVYRLSLKPLEQNHVPRVIEAISEGVSFTSLEHSANADSVVVLRPRLSKVEKAIAIKRAFHYSGRPYDFNFDFLTDASLVCSELVYKAYEPGGDMKQGLHFELMDVLGRKALPVNKIAQQFDQYFGSSQQQLDFVLFLDGSERQGRAIQADLDDFRESWKRPKWHILLRQEL